MFLLYRDTAVFEFNAHFFKKQKLYLTNLWKTRMVTNRHSVLILVRLFTIFNPLK